MRLGSGCCTDRTRKKERKKEGCSMRWVLFEVEVNTSKRDIELGWIRVCTPAWYQWVGSARQFYAERMVARD